MYSPEQREIIAREYARAGSVLGAVRILRDEYESFREIGEATLRRMLRDATFQDLCCAAQQRQAAARAEAAVANERLRAQREMETSLLGQLRRDEALTLNLQLQIERELQKPDAKLTDAMRFWERLQETIERRRRDIVPAVANTEQATLLVSAMMEVALDVLGQGKARDFARRVREKYQTGLRVQDARMLPVADNEPKPPLPALEHHAS